MTHTSLFAGQVIPVAKELVEWRRRPSVFQDRTATVSSTPVGQQSHSPWSRSRAYPAKSCNSCQQQTYISLQFLWAAVFPFFWTLGGPQQGTSMFYIFSDMDFISVSSQPPLTSSPVRFPQPEASSKREHQRAEILVMLKREYWVSPLQGFNACCL